MFENINELAVLVSALVSVAVASIWYSPTFFGALWMRGAGIASPSGEIDAGDMIRGTLQSIVVHGVFFYIIAQFIQISVKNEIPLHVFGTFIMVLLAVSLFSPVIWEKKPVSYFLIHAGYLALSVSGGMAIIAYWPW